ncbi:MAG: hypothetical protein KJZ83_23055 [Burkholderiaceae bacterium]|nr:hypothetical protein [Burkholderiaceae bacterium]
MKNPHHWHAFRCVHPSDQHALSEWLLAKDELERKAGPAWAFKICDNAIDRLTRSSTTQRSTHP